MIFCEGGGGKGEGEPVVMGLNRWLSRITLSSFFIFASDSLDMPSLLSISVISAWRGGWSSGCAPMS